MNQFYSVFYVCIHVAVTTAWDRVIYEEYSFSHSADKAVQDQGTSSTSVSKGMFSCVQDGAVCCSSGGSNACLHNRKTAEERGNVCWNFKPFCKGVNLILKDGVHMAQSPLTDWASVCVPLRMVGQSDVLEGTQSCKPLLFVISTLYLCMYNLLYNFLTFFWWEVWG